MKFRDLGDDFRGWIRIEGGEVLLVGDVNQLGGDCDHCRYVYADGEVEILVRLDAPPLAG